MSKTKVKLRIDKRSIINRTDKALVQALDDCAQDLENMAAQCAPIDFGTLEGSGFKQEIHTGKKVGFEVAFSVKEKNFNYAWYTHEHHPVGGIGAKTKAKPDGQSGITGKTYPAGGNYLKGPFELNAPGYSEYINTELKKALRR